jgi:hypothetical protein
VDLEWRPAEPRCPPSVQLDWLYFPDTRTDRRLTHRCPSSSEPFSNLRPSKTCAEQMERIREQETRRLTSMRRLIGSQQPTKTARSAIRSAAVQRHFKLLPHSGPPQRMRIDGPPAVLHSITAAVTIGRAPSTPIECQSMRQINKVTEPHGLGENVTIDATIDSRALPQWPHSAFLEHRLIQIKTFKVQQWP